MKHAGLIIIALVAVAAGLVSGATPAHAAAFTVNSTADWQDSDTSIVACDTGNVIVRDSVPEPECTLRAAIEQANAGPTADTISFNIIVADDPGCNLFAAGVCTIEPDNPLPIISQPAAIDATTQSGFVDKPVIHLYGISAGALADGIHITGGSSTVRGLIINKFGSVAGSDGIELQFSGSNVIEGNFIGTDVTGTITDPNPIVQGDEWGNAGDGVFINGSANNTVGGTAGTTPGGPCTGRCNLISGAGRNVLTDSRGVEIGGPGATGNVVQANFIGSGVNGYVPPAPDATIDLGNEADGVFINDVSGNTVGGTAAGAGNLIAGNDSDGVEIRGSAATGNFVRGNLIGTASNGVIANIATKNTFYGVYLNGAANNTVGGTTAAARNVISGNLNGVQIQFAGATGNLVQGNYVGTDITGGGDLGNVVDGVVIVGQSGNTIGGTAAGAGNVISGNNSDGIDLNTGASGNLVQGNVIGANPTATGPIANGMFGVGNGVRIHNSPGNTIGGTAAGARNIVSGNTKYGIEVLGSSNDTIIQGNYIGTNATATAALPNGTGGGISVNGTPNALIGGTAAGAQNVISGNGLGFVTPGVQILGSTATGNRVEGNLIGTDVTGTAAIPNLGDGVLVVGAPGNTIGGTTPAARNIISGNGVHGVEIDQNAGTSNLVQGNYIGVKAGGSQALGNGGDGVFVSDAPGNIIGGTSSGARNVISANGAAGVELLGSGSTGNLVQGNYMGIDAAGTLALGNVQYGVFINGAANSTIGGTTAGARNVISDNGAGIFVSSAASGNSVRGNYIGTDAAGTGARGNTFEGVRVGGGATNNTIGGSAAGTANKIAHSGSNGVTVDSGSGNSILSNSIFSNASLGIDLGADGVSANDAGDGDSGANLLQNYPSISAATGYFTITRVTGTFNSTPSTTFTLQFFATPACDSSGFGEGTTFLGSFTRTTDGAGNASFTNESLPTGGVGGQFITATATDPNGNTSEFAACQLSVLSTDQDADGRPDLSDNCPLDPNFDQANFDGDSQGDVCDLDADNDKVYNVDEQNCGVTVGGHLDPSRRPERVDGAFAGVSDDGDAPIDEALPSGSQNFDCDGDGFKGSIENSIYAGMVSGRDQDPCGTNGWPADLPGASANNALDIQDLASFVAPVRRLNTSPGNVDFSARWDLVPGATIGDHINVTDLAALMSGPTGYPPMFAPTPPATGGRAFGQTCPWAP